jgi:MFS family permease
MEKTVTAPTQGRPFSGVYRGWLLFMLLIVCAINYADRSVVGAVAEPLRRDLQLTDFHLGLLQGLSFALLYSILGIPFARLAERRSRVKIIAFATALWSTATVLCGAAGSFVQLLMMRVGVGVGEAGFMAPASSLIGDHFPRHRRAMATSIMMLGVPVGALVGAMSGGIIAQHLGWRWAFVIMGAPGILIALLVLFTLREPPRGLSEEGGAQPKEVPPLREVAREAFSNPVFRNVLAGGTLAGFGLHGLGQFLGVYFIRVHQLPLSLAGMTFGLVTFASLTIGLLVGGFLADRLGRRHLRYYAIVPAIGCFLCVPLYNAAFLQTDLATSIVLIVLAGTCLLFHYGPGLAIVQNLAGPHNRASMIAVYSLVVNAIALAAAPVLIGLLSDVFASRQMEAAGLVCAAGAASPECLEAMGIGIRHAFMASTLLYLWAGIHYLLAAKSSR